MNSKRRIRGLAAQTGFVLLLAGLWQWAAITWPAPWFPRVDKVALAYVDWFSQPLLTSAIVPSLQRLALGFAIGALLGVSLGMVLGSRRGLDAWMRPSLEFLRFIPAVAILPGALLILGPNDTMRVFVIAFGTIFPVLLATLDGTRRVEPMYLDVARVEGLNSIQTILRVIMPAALPAIFAGLRIALGIALIMMIISELIAADNGIGFALLRAQRLFQSARVYGGVLAIGTISLLLSQVFAAVETRTLAWHTGWRGAGR